MQLNKKYRLVILLLFFYIASDAQEDNRLIVGNWKTYFRIKSNDTIFSDSKFDEYYEFKKDYSFKRIPYSPKGSTKGNWQFENDSLIIQANKKSGIEYYPLRYKVVFISPSLFYTKIKEGKKYKREYYYYFKRQ